jgi:hypothetical protein
MKNFQNKVRPAGQKAFASLKSPVSAVSEPIPDGRIGQIGQIQEICEKVRQQ